MNSLIPALRRGLCCLFVAATPLCAAPPCYDHVVIVVEEKRPSAQIIGNTAEAPYINLLARDGVVFTNFHAVAHPSQPNYLHLFSGSNQGVTSDATPTHTPFSTANLGAELIAAGLTFVGYSEDLPIAGDAYTDREEKLSAKRPLHPSA